MKPVPREQLAEFEPFFAEFEARNGFLPNSFLTLGHRPEILRGWIEFSKSLMFGGTVDLELKRLVALVASTAAGCRYCQAHMATLIALLDESRPKLDAVWEFETDPIFSEAERAALRLARDAAQVPNATTSAHFDDLRAHFDDARVVEIMATIGMFGFLNRWNDTMVTELEAGPLDVASATLGPRGWDPGKHRAR